MTRGRKSTAPAIQQGPDFMGKTPATVAEPEARMALAIHEAEGNAQALADQLGYEGSLTVGALEDEIRFYQRRTVEASLELGKRLLILREMAPHGEFVQRMELLGIGRDMGQKFMSATLKFSKAASTRLLEATGTQTKMLELLTLDDGEIAALERGESARGITLDEIEAMSVRELRTALREAKANEEAHEKILTGKDKLANELDKRLKKAERRIATLEPDERLAEIRAELLGFAIEVEGALVNRLRPAFQTLTAHIAEHGGTCDEYLSGCLGQIEQRLRELREEYGLNQADVAAWSKS